MRDSPFDKVSIDCSGKQTTLARLISVKMLGFGQIVRSSIGASTLCSSDQFLNAFIVLKINANLNSRKYCVEMRKTPAVEMARTLVYHLVSLSPASATGPRSHLAGR